MKWVFRCCVVHVLTQSQTLTLTLDQIHGVTWKCVEAIRMDARQGIPDHDLSMKNMTITDDTDVVDIFWKMMPLDRDALCKIVRERAEDIDDKKYRNWNVHHIDEAIKVTIGGAQFTIKVIIGATLREEELILCRTDEGDKTWSLAEVHKIYPR